MIINGIKASEYITKVNRAYIQPNGIDLTVKSIKMLNFYSDTLNVITKTTTFDHRLYNLPLIKPTVHETHPEVNGYLLHKGIYSVEFNEGCKLVDGVSANIYHRSSIVRMGNFITSGYYDTGFEVDNMGCILHVNSSLFIELNGRIAQIVLQESENTFSYNGQYNKNKDVK